MKPNLCKDLIAALKTVESDRHRLVVVLGKFGAGKTDLLKKVAAEVDGVYLNLNLELSERLLSIPISRYRDGITVHQIIDELCDEISSDQKTLLIDNLELLFSPELGKINPIDTFKRISRQRPVAIALPAQRHGTLAVYSSSGHDDYFAMPLEDYTVIEVSED